MVVLVNMAFIRIDSLLSHLSSTKHANLAQRVQYLRLTIAGAPDISFQSLHTMDLSLTGMNFVQKKSSVDIAHIFFGKPSLSNSAKGWVTILQKHFSQKYKFEFVGKKLCRNNSFPIKYLNDQIYSFNFAPSNEIIFSLFQALRGHCFCSFEFDLLRQRRYTA